MIILPAWPVKNYTPRALESLCSIATINVLRPVKAKVMLRLTVIQSVCLGVKFTLELVTRYYFLSESCCVASVGCPFR
jgi:hypothetical protein